MLEYLQMVFKYLKFKRLRHYEESYMSFHKASLYYEDEQDVKKKLKDMRYKR